MADTSWSWNDWPQDRVDALLTAFRERGWEQRPSRGSEHLVKFEASGKRPNRMVSGGRWLIACPIDTWGDDTAAICQVAAAKLIEAEGDPVLEIGPLTEREAAYAAMVRA